jgi:integrase
MSVRRRKWRDPATGVTKECWMIDVVVEHKDGRRERVRKVAPVQSKRAAEQYERELRAELLMGSSKVEKEVVEEAPRFEAFAAEFLSTYAKTNNKPSEVRSKEAILRVHLVPAFGKLRIDAIGPKEVETYKARKLTEGLSPKSVNNHLTVLRRVLALAVEWGKLRTVPVIRWLRVPEQPFDFLSFEEAARLVQAADSSLWHTMIVVGLRTGLRQGELLALRWEDVDLTAGRLLVRRSVVDGIIGTPKNGKGREVPLGEEVLRILKAFRHLRGPLVFCAEDGRMLTKGECKHPLWRTCRRAGLRRIGWHVLRHTFASHLAMRGVALKAIQELLGHATIEMTMRYAHLSPDVRRDAVKLLDEPSAPDHHAAAAHGTYAAHERRVKQN